MSFKTLSFSILLASGLILYSSFAQTESVETFKKEQEIVRVQMVQLSRELGVTCTECHSAKNWKDGTKPTFKIAKDHMKTIEILRSNGFNGKKAPEATCFMCHQGKLKFASRMQHPEGSAVPEAKTED